MLRRMLPFSTLTQFFAVGTNQLRRGARSLMLAEQVGRVRDVAVRLQRLLRLRARVGLDPVGRERLVGAVTGTARSEPPRKPGMTWPLTWPGITNCAGRALVLLADAAGVPARPDDRRRLALRVDVVRLRVVSRSVLLAFETAFRSSCTRSGRRSTWRGEQALPLAAHLRRDAAAVVEHEAHREVPVGTRDVDGREALLRALRRASHPAAWNCASVAGTSTPPSCRGRCGR